MMDHSNSFCGSPKDPFRCSIATTSLRLPRLTHTQTFSEEFGRNLPTGIITTSTAVDLTWQVSWDAALQCDDSTDSAIPENRRGRTPDRVEYAHCPSGSSAGSRASSASSVRSIIDQCLGWAQGERLRSGSRESVSRSLFHEHSPFYGELSRAQPRGGVHKCECCPKKRKSFDTEDDLR
jgi:hypothetical protein